MREQIEVECYSGYRANERPTAIVWRGQRLRVSEILDRWYEGGRTPAEPSLDYFKIRLEDGRELLVAYNRLFDVWTTR